jgi:hypothetical protein
VSGRARGSGRIVSPDALALMMTPRSDWPEESRRYGLGFHLHASREAAWLEGYDAGVSIISLHEPRQDLTHTVISNRTDGAWPIVNLLTSSWDSERTHRDPIRAHPRRLDISARNH